MAQETDITETQLMVLREAETYYIFDAFCQDEELRALATYGLDSEVQFDIRDYFNGRMLIKSKTGIIIYKGWAVPERIINDELARRTRHMKAHLREVLFKKESWMKARGTQHVERLTYGQR